MTTATKLTVLYRGPLSSCNYGCEYCPFAKRMESRAELAADESALRRFVTWVAGRRERGRMAVFFTPWGEALIRRHYRRALAELTQMSHVDRAAIQTNLGNSVAWVEDCEPSRLGVWATFHPEWASRSAFVGRVRELHERGVNVSAGIVGLKRFYDQIAALRSELPAGVYLWINAFKRMADYYGAADVARLRRIDPLFPVNTHRHASLGRRCRTGHTVIAVDGEGNAKRCHFVPERLGNIYDRDFDRRLQPTPCSQATCGCHIGYVHLEHLELERVFGAGILERVPSETFWPPAIRSEQTVDVDGEAAEGGRGGGDALAVNALDPGGHIEEGALGHHGAGDRGLGDVQV